MIVKNESGQTLFELVFAFGIMALVVVAVVGMAIISIRNSSYSRNKTLAEKYANEAYEWIRNERDESWNDFKSKVGGVYCAPSLPTSINDLSGVACDELNDNQKIQNTVLFRNVGLSWDENDVKVVITVFWNDSKGKHETNLTTVLGNW